MLLLSLIWSIATGYAVYTLDLFSHAGFINKFMIVTPFIMTLCILHLFIIEMSKKSKQ